jgi:hypothetical protein
MNDLHETIRRTIDAVREQEAQEARKREQDAERCIAEKKACAAMSVNIKQLLGA